MKIPDRELFKQFCYAGDKKVWETEILAQNIRSKGELNKLFKKWNIYI